MDRHAGFSTPIMLEEIKDNGVEQHAQTASMKDEMNGIAFLNGSADLIVPDAKTKRRI